jgi:hypothetical protein
MTHDLMATLIEGFDGHLDAVEVTDLQDGSFLASLAISGPGGERRFDTRPSDGIALAVRLHAPLYVSEHVLAEAGSLPTVELDEVAIDAEVDQFRSFLAELEPGDFDDETASDTDQSNDPDITDNETAPDTDQPNELDVIASESVIDSDSDSESDVIDSELDVTDNESDVIDSELDDGSEPEG